MLTGCPWSSVGHLADLGVAESYPTAAGAGSAASEPTGKPESSPHATRRVPNDASRGQDPSPPSSDWQTLAEDAWVYAAQPSQPADNWPAYRWRHAGLDMLLARPENEGPDLHAALTDRNPVVAANAAIALARRGNADGVDQLAAAVHADRAKLPRRCAAAEALGCLPHEAARQRIVELADRFGRDPREGNPDYLAELHAELIRSMVRQGARAADPRDLAATRSPAPGVRLAAVQAWLHDTEAPLPAEAIDWRVDPDARVRLVALSVLVRHRHPDAKAFLVDGLNDQDFRVRTTAIAELGTLPGGEGRELLRRLLKDRSEMVRAPALASLAASGAGEDEVLPMAKDKSWRVRAVVAESLHSFPSRGGMAVAKALLDDPSPVVQEKVIASLAAWELPEAGPVLLEAIGKVVVMTRRTAARQLAARWPPAAEFSPDGAPERRNQRIVQLRQQFRDQFGVESGVVRTAAAVSLPPETLDRVEQLLQGLSTAEIPRREAAVHELKAVGPSLIAALERLAIDRRLALSEVVYVEVLPAISPTFASLERLRFQDVSLRRRAATELMEFASERPLSSLALERLASIAVREPDALVWQTLLTAVGNDPREPATRLAYTAIGHQAPEVRRRACEYLAAHPSPSHVPVLLPALDDPSEVVVLAAARAIGFVGRLDNPQPLHRLLMALNESIRLEAAVALTRLKDPAGPGALERLAYAQDPVVRRVVAATMGEMADPAFAPTLIRLLDDQQAVRRAALEALPKVAGRDVTAAEGLPPEDLSQRIELWKRWFRGERSARR